MELTKVESSNIEAVGYDNGLIVEFKSGVKYKYEAPETEFKKLLESTSKGQFVNTEIKPKYKYTKL